MLPWQEFADHLSDDRRAAHPATDEYCKTHVALFVAHRLQTDVVQLDRCAILRGSGHGDLEFARQKSELRMKSRPLPQHFRPHQRVHDFVGRHTREVIGGDIADAIAAGLNGVHFNLSEIGQNVRHFGQLGPVKLNILPRAEVAIAAVVLARDVGEHAHLRRGQHAVRHSYTQHRRVLLHIQPVLQP